MTKPTMNFCLKNMKIIGSDNNGYIIAKVGPEYKVEIERYLTQEDIDDESGKNKAGLPRLHFILR